MLTLVSVEHIDIDLHCTRELNVTLLILLGSDPHNVDIASVVLNFVASTVHPEPYHLRSSCAATLSIEMNNQTQCEDPAVGPCAIVIAYIQLSCACIRLMHGHNRGTVWISSSSRERLRQCHASRIGMMPQCPAVAAWLLAVEHLAEAAQALAEVTRTVIGPPPGSQAARDTVASLTRQSTGPWWSSENLNRMATELEAHAIRIEVALQQQDTAAPTAPAAPGRAATAEAAGAAVEHAGPPLLPRSGGRGAACRFGPRRRSLSH